MGNGSWLQNWKRADFLAREGKPIVGGKRDPFSPSLLDNNPNQLAKEEEKGIKWDFLLGGRETNVRVIFARHGGLGMPLLLLLLLHFTL